MIGAAGNLLRSLLRRPRRPGFRSITLAAGAVWALTLAGCEIDYLARGAYQEARLLWHRRPISEELAKGDLAPDVRAKLEMVLEVRSFARDRVGLNVGGAYSSITPVDEGAITWVVMAAPKD